MILPVAVCRGLLLRDSNICLPWDYKSPWIVESSVNGQLVLCKKNKEEKDENSQYSGVAVGY